MPNLYKFNLGNDFIARATEAIEDFIMESESRPIRIALSGGSSPKAVYEKLTKSEKIDWSKVEIFIVDERADNSNKEMIEEALISKLPTLKKFHPLSDKTENELLKLNRPFFDLVLLGLGGDGHTASIFPHSTAITELEKLVLHTQSPAGVKERITLSFPAILSTEKIIFLIRGANKKEIIDELLSDDCDEQKIPARVALEHEDVDIYYDYGE